MLREGLLGQSNPTNGADHETKPLFRNNFSPEVLAAAHEIVLIPELLEGRERVGGIAIDPPGALDKDDAFDIEKDGTGVVVHVSIADPTIVIVRGNPVHDEAMKRAFTRYYGMLGKDPMVPEVLSDDRLSLHEGVARPAFTVSIPVGRSFSIGEPVLRRTVLTSRSSLSYAEADEALSDPRHPESNNLNFALGMGFVLARRRETRYSLEDMTEISEEGQVKQINWGEGYRSMILIRELMVLTNRLTARHALENGIPFLYRSHEQMDKPAYYSAAYLGHAGLGFEVGDPYAHWTSPLRRLSDSINHEQQGAFLGGKSLPYDPYELEGIADYINEAAVRERSSLNRAAYQKAVFNEQAIRALANNDFVAAAKIPFRRVVKAAVDRGMVDVVRPWIMHKLEDGSLLPSHIVPLLFSASRDVAVVKTIDGILTANPALSREALETFCREKEVPPLQFRSETVRTKPDRYVETLAALRLGRTVFDSDPIPGSAMAPMKAVAAANFITTLRDTRKFRKLLE